MKFITLAVAFLAPLASALPGILPRAPVLPSQDPFYVQPANIDTFAPGAVVKTRQIPTNLNGLLPGSPVSTKVKAAYQYMYRTTDAIGRPVAAVTTLLVPFNADPTKLLAYQQAYDSANNNCAPSYAVQSGANTTAVADVVMITAALNQGWYIITPDFEGLNATFTVGTSSGYATLDSVRAALNEAPRTAGLSKTAKYVMWGYSGGALGSEWAAELQPRYAPELKFEGIALGGLTPNITSVLFTINKGIFSGLAFSGIYGYIKAYPNLTDYANAHFIPAKRDEFFSIANGCLTQSAVAGAFKDLFTYADRGIGLVNDPEPRSVLAAAGQMGVYGTPQAPMYVYKAMGDEISPEADTHQLVDTLCRKGANVEYVQNFFGEHVSEAILGSATALSWVKDRLEGKAVANKSCLTRQVIIATPEVGTGIAAAGEIVALLQVLLAGGNLGPAFGLPLSG